MALIPDFKMTWFNGLLPFSVYVVLFAIVVASFSKGSRARLYDRSSWNKKQQVYIVISKLSALVNIVLFGVSPLRVHTTVFKAGSVLFIVSMVGLIHALIVYKNTKLDEPVIKGAYRFSRNPQMLCIWLIFLAVCLMINSLLSIILLLVGIFCSHKSILAEEEMCIQKYGKAYIAYKESVPRYLFF